jgi:aldose 1-epimerase
MTTALLTLEDQLTRLTLAPELGASIVNWTLLANGHALLRPSDQQALQAHSPRRLACYPLAPWSNRIGQGGFSSPDGWFALAANSPNDPLPIHGSAWQQPWQVIEQSASQACLQLESAEPFAYRAQQRFHLHAGCLKMHMQVTHLDPRAAWHGLGWHPYFPRTAHTRLRAVAQQLWQCDQSRLSSELAALPADWDFTRAQPLPVEQIDNAFTGWDGNCEIIQDDAGYQLKCRSQGADYFILYTPSGQDFFCFEPVSHPVNAHHLPGHPGLRLLRQGQSCEMSFSLQYQTLPLN